MIVISDTNILSSFAAGDAFHLLFQLFTKTKIHTPPSVKHELQAGIAHGHKRLPKTLANIEDSKQLIKASGSVGVNYIEANEALGKKDFLMRIRISRKEAKESAYWLRTNQ